MADRATPSPRTPVLWFAMAAAAILAGWGVVKAWLFERLAYTSDLFSTLLIARSWVDGRPLLSENAFGRFADQHNVYALLLLGPVTAWIGVYGLFLPYLLLLFLAAWSVFRFLPDDRVRLLAAAILLGPTTFYIWDNPIYGFHSELFLLPVGVLYATALAAGSRLRWPLLLALFTIHEQGPLVGLGVHLAVAMSPGVPATFRENIAVVARLVAGYGALFVAGLLLLRLNSDGQTRVGQALDGLSRTLSDVEARASLLGDLGSWVLLMAPAGAVIVLSSRHRRMWVGTALALGPLLAAAIVGRSLYVGSGLGLTWSPRLVGAWTVGTAAAILALGHMTRARGYGWRWPVTLAVAGSLLVYQAWALQYIRDYDVVSRVTLRRSAELPASQYAAAELRALACMSASLDRGTHVATNGDLFAKFHMNAVVWPERLTAAFRPPQLLVCDAMGRTVHGGPACQALIDERVAGAQFEEARFEGLRVAYDRDTGRAIAGCLQGQ